jgi:SAM-dependent methyltransferase
MSKLEQILKQGPVFCFGSDTDWHSEQTIDLLLENCAEQSAKITVFATHASATLGKTRDLVEIALHPNFLPESTHGRTVDEVIQHVFDLFPSAKTYRSHSYFDNQHITQKMAERGIRYDANLCLYRQAELRPLRHCHIDWRFPSWLDDNVHWYHNGSWRLADLIHELEKPGLKLINIHPASFALNLPNFPAYQRLKASLGNADQDFIAANCCTGHGPRSFLNELLHWLRDRHPTYHLSQLYALQSETETLAIDPRLVASSAHSEVAGRPPVLGDYARADDWQRMEMVRAQYNAFKERGRYATSRDYNSREIEIDGIRRYLTGTNILDLGCGNGYTLLSLATEMTDGSLVGVDFSNTMIDDAKAMMTREFAQAARLRLEFICEDVLTYLNRVAPGDFDTIISERLVLNLPSWELQHRLIDGIIERLPRGGKYLMMEATKQGFQILNEVRRLAGLDTIPDRYAGNESSNKLDEAKLDALFSRRSDVKVERKHLFSFYALASKVLHPLIVAPEQPKFASPINDLARTVQQAMTRAGIELPNIGASKLWVVERIHLG